MLALLMLNRMSMKRRSLRAKETAFKAEKKPDTQSMYCRTCLSAEELVAIFYSPGIEKKRTEELRLVTGLEIMQDDGLSQKMCTSCIEKMNNALQFRKQSRKAEKSLLNMSLGLKPKKKSISKATRKTVKIKSPKVQKIKQKIEKEELDFDCSYDGFQNDDDYPEVPLVDYPEVEEKPKIKQLLKKPAVRKRVSIPNAASYKCPTCAKEFRMKATYKAHMRFHTNYCVCEVSTSICKRVSIPNAAAYKCPTCAKEFRMKATYKTHMRFHTNYCVCEACGKRCRNNNQLQEHKRARHGLGRIHKCAYCEYSSATKEALTIHERRHTGERPYICDHCGASFHRRSNLVQHIAIHLPEKNFQCDMCPKRLKSRKFLQIHKHNAHTGKRYGYLCPVCAHRFEKPNKVRAHARRVHGQDARAPIVRVQL
ncbi:GDNF-inducible zinc finger protein 1-like isoform X2 [Cydia pomonella]|uniref:GDNF-inducible zinc finger protein 1-like isoform X2 n=1 Tax=Cydia pomonella TaxID=82600 RepID=UPI002ADE8836|nr:GDNF-inducible zinc finger protein 1-like isoform X2 [Cydia pomonella]